MKLLITLALIAPLASGGCAGDFAGNGDDTMACDVTLSYSPSMPLAGADTEIRVVSTVSHAQGTLTYRWNVDLNGMVPYQDAQSDHSEITFIATDAGVYHVTLDVSPSSGSFCPQAGANVNVLNDFTSRKARLHITPPASAGAPLVDRPLTIRNAMDYDMGPVVLEPGTVASGQVRFGATGVPAYLQFTPQGMPGAMVEAFTTNTGAFDVRLLDQAHDVVVIPMVAGYAPQRLTYSPGSTLISINTGQGVSGTVHQGATKIANAKVQLTIAGVPTTLATTDANGNFTTLGFPVTGAPVTIEVTPLATSGLPRLESTAMFDASSSIDVNYMPMTLRNVQGIPIRRNANAQASKKVAIVGSIGSAGTITAGATIMGATGYLRIFTTTDATGALPSHLVPAGPLFAVTTIAPNDIAVGVADFTAGLPAQISAPDPFAIVVDAKADSIPIPGAVLDLVPTGALALAGISALHVTTDGFGHLAMLVPNGGTFDMWWSDPDGVRAPLVLGNVTPFSGAYELPKAVYITGDLTVTGSSNPVVGASVQVLCDACTGFQKLRPIAEAATDPHGSFSVAVPDPGAM